MCKRVKNRQWHEDHPGYAKRYRSDHAEHYRQYRQENAHKYRLRAKRWAANNYERAKETIRQSYNKNRIRRLEQKKQYRDANKEKVLKSISRWQERNPVKVNEYAHRRRAKKLDNGGSYTPEEWRSLCDQYENRCLCCGRGDRTLTVDHVVPISKGGSNDISNIQPLCGLCNSSKSDKSTDYRTRPQVKRWKQPKLF